MASTLKDLLDLEGVVAAGKFSLTARVRHGRRRLQRTCSRNSWAALTRSAKVDFPSPGVSATVGGDVNVVVVAVAGS
jgi:hypothetical protein